MFKKMFLLLLLAHSLVAQVAKIDSGQLNGARYRILFPPNWKGKLVMYAHGYEFMGTKPLQSQNPEFIGRMSPFLSRGFAVAASDYQYQGFALPQGVDDTESLRQYFVKQYGKPDSTFMVGHSMGGGITVATIENFGENYHGGLPLCPLSSRPYLQCRKEFDMYATFNGLFPGIVPSLKEIFDLNKKPSPSEGGRAMVAKAMAIRKAMMSKDSVLAVAFAKRFDLKLDDLPFSLFFNENVLRDLAQKSGGNPFDNTNTVYSGFPDNDLVNHKAERLEATVNPNMIFGKYDRTGNINKPVFLLHTVYDQLIPPTYGVVNFENMVHHQQKDQFFKVRYTTGQGHCVFTAQQTGNAFDELRNWVKSGQKPAGDIWMK
ncbi:alpha/beta hydrolase family protein [Flectobacillus sp.]|uniref:alpha/beta hydrolase family protein n=1 Tax=Flectobacillus sp. TaxID=50419 RepID=UPI003BA8C460